MEMRGGSSAAPDGEMATVKIVVGAQHGEKPELRICAVSRGFAVSCPEARIVDVAQESGNERVGGSGLDEKPGEFMKHELGIPTYARGNDRQCRCHGLENGVGHAFAERRKGEYVEAAKDLGHIVTLAKKMHAMDESKRSDHSLEF